jgi:glucose uptake protein GlcU
LRISELPSDVSLALIIVGFILIIIGVLLYAKCAKSSNKTEPTNCRKGIICMSVGFLIVVEFGLLYFISNNV